ncbi:MULTISPECIES: molecular chaperone Tir [Tenacibaculum]|uniref:Molecular chaperone Tir n=1 Tax=Tenacibaculum aiptasiae TaxID=426481 RepID=A0A7J5AAR6_9FLAO|nr:MULTISPECIES: molecular chaperone Tir [Tenacibaculum]KAB1154652.1 molecular chaperone Tir [Tenacibaculum aiptasiae]MCF2876171.1 YbjN domain-containing protein [Tenacibaculum sp. Cn5-1]MCF2936246.1 YbjN domain-containing protein [Tenacibaculum sp. Cn5-34]MCG7511589.1 YbjN domain-containing protein [Tenacibaculum sp. Cn5-46]
MNNHYLKTKNFLQELNVNIIKEDETEGIFVIEKESFGIKNLIIGVAYPIVIIEQFIFKVNQPNEEIFKSLLKKNRDIVHGAFVLDDSYERVIFRDTLQLENLDLNELEASLNSLSLLLSEYSEQIITYSKY